MVENRPALRSRRSCSIGWLMGVVADSGFGNPWYDGLAKPIFQPPGWAFGVVWTTLYIMMGVAVAMILAEPPSPIRKTALSLFFVQLAVNFAWSPIFFGGHMIEIGLVVILAMLLTATATANLFRRIRTGGGMADDPLSSMVVPCDRAQL